MFALPRTLLVALAAKIGVNPGTDSCLGDGTCTLSPDGWGPIRYGTRAADAMTAEGPAVHFQADTAGAFCGSLSTNGNGLHVLVAPNEPTGKIVALDVTNPDIQSDKGIRVGDPWNKVSAAYPTGHPGTDGQGQPDWYVLGTVGALLLTNTNDTVGYMQVINAKDAANPPLEYCG